MMNIIQDNNQIKKNDSSNIIPLTNNNSNIIGNNESINSKSESISSKNKSINSMVHKNNRINTRDLVITGMFTAIICVMSQLTIPVQPIPFSLSLFAIFLAGALLSPRYALLSVLAYILLGAFGAPVFANMKGGPQILIGNTGGYLMAYPIMAFVTAMFYKYIRKYKTFALILGMIVALIICYLFGTLWFTIVTGIGFYRALTLCVFPFVLFDSLKIVLAVSVSIVLRKTAFKTLN